MFWKELTKPFDEKPAVGKSGERIVSRQLDALHFRFAAGLHLTGQIFHATIAIDGKCEAHEENYKNKVVDVPSALSIPN